MLVNTVQIRLLGGVTLSLGGQPLQAFPYDKLKAVLAFLAMQPGVPCARDALASMLWPHSDGSAALGNLRRALFDLRKMLTPMAQPLLQADRRHVSLLNTPGLVVDAMQLLCDELGDAPWLHWRPFLGELNLGDAPAFAQWAQAQEERLRQHTLRRLDVHIQRQLAGGHTPYLIELARQRVALSPASEAGHRQLIRLLGDAGRFDEAKQALDACEHSLRQATGEGPGEQTLALWRHLETQRQQPSLPLRTDQPRQPLTVLVTRWLKGPTDAASASRRAQLHGRLAALTRQQGGQFLPLTHSLWVSCFGVPHPLEDTPGRGWEVALATVPPRASWRHAELAMGLAHGWTEPHPGVLCPDATGEVLNEALSLALAGQGGWLHLAASVRGLLSVQGRLPQGLTECEQQGVRVPLAGPDRPRSSSLPVHDPSRLIGREPELTRLQNLWTLARGGQSLHVQVMAEAGMGKTRLVTDFLRQVRGRGERAWLLVADEATIHQPWEPIIQLLQQVLRDRPSTSVARRERSLRRVLCRLSHAWVSQAAVIRRLLGMPSDLDALAAEPGQVRLHLELGLVALISGVALEGGLLLVVEDTHWLDDASLAVLHRLSEPGQAAQPWMVLSTARPGGPSTRATHTLSLGSLGAHHARLLVDARCHAVEGARRLDEAALAAIVARADGVPLYLEQLVLALASGSAQTQAVPPTLRELLVARIVGLGPHRHVAQLAALSGRQVDLPLIHLYGADQPEALQHSLDALQEDGILQRGEDGGLVFRHALIQEAACAAMPRASREAAHRRLGELMRIHLPDRVRAHPEQLAHHLDLGISPDAPAAWLAAARSMNRVSEPSAACHHLEKGLAALSHMADAPPRYDMAFRLWVELGNTRVALHGYGSQQSRAAYGEALALCDRLSDDVDLFQVMWGLWLGSRTVADQSPPLAFADRLAHAARGSEDPGVRLQVHYAYGNNHFWLGQYPQARARLNQAVALGRSVDISRMIVLYGEASHVCAMAFLSWLDWLEGRPTQALRQAQSAIDEARRTGHAHTLCFALTFACTLHRYLRMPQETLQLARQVGQLADVHGLRLWQAAAASLQGWALASLGQAEGLVPIRMGLAGAQQAMAAVETTFIAFLADALCQLGQDEEAAVVLADGMAKARAIPDVYLLPEFLRLEGERLARQSSPDLSAAQATLEEGLAIAQEQGAWGLVLRLQTSLARLSTQRAPCWGPAHDALQACLARLDDGAPLPDFQMARDGLDLKA
ncbi:AAA family ATPase [Aquabacterium sp.]|uniref:AAA family ATPase n=1 Tax=Aquabacterium sp. TaxID=1872578 RepID=UPI0025C410CC|nr:AAA family ATPase [Aquabacterium sp.]